MMPFSSPERMVRESTRGRIGGRTHEIQRMIGQALRAVVDLESIGPRTIWIDCEVLQADGGTRTASVTGGFVALRLACGGWRRRGSWNETRCAGGFAAVSVRAGGRGDTARPRLRGEVAAPRSTLNLVVTGERAVRRIQGTAETEPFTAEEMASLTAMARSGIAALIETQKRALEGRS